MAKNGILQESLIRVIFSISRHSELEKFCSRFVSESAIKQRGNKVNADTESEQLSARLKFSMTEASHSEFISESAIKRRRNKVNADAETSSA